MDEILPFTLERLQNHPHEAAKVLERLDYEDTVAFLEEIPPSIAAKLLETVIPQYCAQCLLVLSPEATTAIVQAMKPTSFISLLRFIPNSVTKSILETLLPEKKALLSRHLAYPQNTVGAWMDSDGPAIPEVSTMGELRRSLRSSRKTIEYGPCVVKPDGSIAGVLTLARLINAKDSLSVSKLLTANIRPVSDHDSLQTAALSPDWDQVKALPVTNLKGDFVGMLSQNSLNKGLSTSNGGVIPVTNDSVLADGVGAYLSAVSWLAQALADFLTRPFPRKGIRK